MAKSIVVLLVVALAFFRSSSGAFAQTASLAMLKVGAGVGSGTVAGNVYAPGAIAVHVGDSVTWTINSDEPHSVTFGQGPGGAPPRRGRSPDSPRHRRVHPSRSTWVPRTLRAPAS